MAGIRFLCPRVRDAGVTRPRGEVTVAFQTATVIQTGVFGNVAPNGGVDEDAAISFYQSDRGVKLNARPGQVNSGPSIYTWINREIGVFNSPVFVSDFTVTLQRDYGGGDYGRHTGLYFMVGAVTGKRYVVGVANSTTNGNLVLVRCDLDTRTWTQHEIPTGLGVSLDGLHSCVTYHGMLFCSAGTFVVGIDPDQPEVNWTVATVGAGSVAPLTRLVVAYDRLLLVLQRGTNMEIWERIGSAMVQLTLPATMPDAVANNRFSVLPTDGEIQIVYVASTGPNNGLRHYAFSMNSPTPLDVGSGGEFTGMTVPPGTDANFPTDPLRWSFFQIGPGNRTDALVSGQMLNESPWTGNYSAILLHCSSPADQLTQDIFAAGGLGGFWTQITQLGASPPYQLPSNCVWPGGNIWGTTEHCHLPGDVSVVSLLSAVQIPGENRFRLRFFVNAPGTTTGLHVAFFYTQPSDGPMTSFNRCSLIGPVVGVDQFATPAVLSGDKVIDVTAELSSDLVNPATIYEVTWDADADGFPPDSWGRIMAFPMPTFIP